MRPALELALNVPACGLDDFLELGLPAVRPQSGPDSASGLALGQGDFEAVEPLFCLGWV
jgi:hypothetical protein